MRGCALAISVGDQREYPDFLQLAPALYPEDHLGSPQLLTGHLLARRIIQKWHECIQICFPVPVIRATRSSWYTRAFGRSLIPTSSSTRNGSKAACLVSQSVRSILSFLTSATS